MKRFNRQRDLLLTFLADLGFLWALGYFGFGGWQTVFKLLPYYGFWALLVLGIVLFLLLYRSDYRIDLPLFFAGLLLGYWGEWWGTTRGVWTYWNGAQPPVYLPPLWGLGLLTVYRLSRFLTPPQRRTLPQWAKWAMTASFFVFPILAFARSFPLLARVDWRGRLDFNFFAGVLVTLALILPSFELEETFAIYLCGMLLGGIYEFLGTSIGEWTYITREVPPLWIAPLWGLAAAAMVRLAKGLRWLLSGGWKRRKID